MVHCIGQHGFPSQEELLFIVTDLGAFDFTLNTLEVSDVAFLIGIFNIFFLFLCRNLFSN